MDGHDLKFKEKAKRKAGTRFTVLLECVDEEASAALLNNLFADKGKAELVAGCRVLRVDFIDQLDNVKLLKRKIQELQEVLEDTVLREGLDDGEDKEHSTNQYLQ